MSKFNNLLSLIMGMSNYTNEYFEYVITDEEVNNCLVLLYFSMLSGDKYESDKYYNDFEEKYNALTDEQKEMAKIEIAKILNIEYEPKIKKKEKRRDE